MTTTHAEARKLESKFKHKPNQSVRLNGEYGFSENVTPGSSAPHFTAQNLNSGGPMTKERESFDELGHMKGVDGMASIDDYYSKDITDKRGSGGLSTELDIGWKPPTDFIWTPPKFINDPSKVKAYNTAPGKGGGSITEGEEYLTLENPRVYNAFKRDFKFGLLNVGSKCNLRCAYCSQFSNPPNLLLNYNGWLTLEETKHFLQFVPNKMVTYLGTSSWVCSGDFFSHPDHVEILQYMYDNDYNISVEVFTNGQLLTESSVKLLRKMFVRSMEVQAKAYHEDEYRFRYGSDKVPVIDLHILSYDKTKHALDYIDQYDLNYMTCIVPTRSILNNGRVEKWIASLQDHNPLMINIWKPGFTKFTHPKVAKDMAITNAELFFLVEEWGKKYTKIPLNYQYGVGHEASILKSLNFVRQNFSEHTSIAEPNFLFLTSKSVESVFELVVERFTEFENYYVKTAENKTFGGSCDISGLLLVKDYMAAIDEAISDGFDPEYIVLPENSFFYEDKDLGGISPKLIYEKYNIPVVWC